MFVIMKVNFNKNFKDFRGTELPGESIAHTVAEALFNHGTGTPAPESEKRMAYNLSRRIFLSEGDTEITAEEAAFIERVCAEKLTAGGYGQVYELIEGTVL